MGFGAFGKRGPHDGDAPCLLSGPMGDDEWAVPRTGPESILTLSMLPKASVVILLCLAVRLPV